MSYVGDFSVLFEVFVRQEVAINENIRIVDHASGIPGAGLLQIDYELGK